VQVQQEKNKEFVSQQSISTKSSMSDRKVEFATNMFKLLGHPLRLRIVELLDIHGEETVNRIAELTQQPQSTVSLYLNRLKGSGLLKSRRAGNQTFYAIAEEKLPILLDCMRECELD
jgi:DNA-binding transcriptional ArsR family regulator